MQHWPLQHQDIPQSVHRVFYSHVFKACELHNMQHYLCMAPSTSYTHAVLTWPVEVQVTGQLFICVICVGKAVVDTVMDWLEVEELQLDKLLGGWRDCLCQCRVHQVPITDHHPILVEGHSEGITCVSGGAADGEGSSSVEVGAELWVSEGSVAWPHSRRWCQTRYQREACQRVLVDKIWLIYQKGRNC